MSAVKRFIYGYLDSIVIDGRGLQPDPELEERNRQRVREVIKGMGEKWCLHNPRWPADVEAAANEEAELAAHSYTEGQ